MAQPGINVPGPLRLGNQEDTTAVEVGRAGALVVNNSVTPPAIILNGPLLKPAVYSISGSGVTVGTTPLQIPWVSPPNVGATSLMRLAGICSASSTTRFQATCIHIQQTRMRNLLVAGIPPASVTNNTSMDAGVPAGTGITYSSDGGLTVYFQATGTAGDTWQWSYEISIVCSPSIPS